MKKRLLSLAMVLVLCLSLLTGCSQVPELVRLPISETPSSFDPQISGTEDTQSVLNNCYEGLVRLDSDGNVLPGVATSWSISGDGLTYTFDLRTDARWHITESAKKTVFGDDESATFDNRVTANDFVFAFRRAVDPNTASPYAGTLLNLKNADAIYAGELSTDALGVSAQGDYTLVIQLNHPDSGFLSSLASVVCMPCNEQFFEATIGRYGMTLNYTICNGPYYLSTVDSSYGYVELTKNEDYQGEYAPMVPSVRFVLASDQGGTASENTTDILTSLKEKDGGLDAGLVSSDTVTNVTKDMELREYQNSTKAFLFNMTGDITRYRDLRLAFVSATNPALLGASATCSGLVPPTCELVSGELYRDEAGAVSVPTFSVSKAKEYYNDAIEKLKEQAEDEDDVDNQLYKITLACLASDKNDITSVVQNWQKVFGVNLSVEVATYDTQSALESAISAGSYDIAYTSLKVSEFTASSFLSRFMSGNINNVINLTHETYDGYITTAMSSSDTATVKQNLIEAEDFLVRNGCILPIRFDSTWLVTKDTAQGLYVLPSGSIYAAYDIASEHRSDE